MNTANGGEANPKVLGLLLGIVAVVCLVMAIVAPVLMARARDDHLCAPAESLNFAEQMVCKPKYVGYTFYTSAEYPKLVKVYREDSMDLNNVTRVQKYKNYETTLSEHFDDFSLSVPISVFADLTVKCTGDNCNNVKLFWLTDSQFNSAFNSAGEFMENAYNPEKVGFGESDEVHVASSVNFTNGVYHIIFSNNQSSSVKIVYSATLTYTVYDVSKLKPQSCSGKCDFDDLKSGEVIIMEYPSTSGEHEYFDASIYYKDNINWSNVLSTAFVLAGVGILCAIVSACYLKKVLKKIGKFGKKVGKKIEEEAEKQAEKQQEQSTPATPASPSTPVANSTPSATPSASVADPSYGQQQQTYAADPSYGQQQQPYAYPAEQSYPAEPSYPGQPAYPGQM